MWYLEEDDGRRSGSPQLVNPTDDAKQRITPTTLIPFMILAPFSMAGGVFSHIANQGFHPSFI